MNLVKVNMNDLKENSHGNDVDSPGIYEVVLEKEVVRTYSNGLSFKHVSGGKRRNYQVAVSARIQELGLESARQCQVHAPFITSIFTRWRNIEEKYTIMNDLPQSRIQEELNALARVLEIPCDGMDVHEIHDSLNQVLNYRDPKFLAAKFASLCKDRSNLGQSSFLRLVASGRGYLDMSEKISWLFTLFKDEPEEFLSFLLLGRAPWTEKRLSRRYKSSFTWARNFLVGVHNKFTHSLNTLGIKLPGISFPQEPDLLEILNKFIKEVREYHDKIQEEGANTTATTSFLNSVEKIRIMSPDLIDWFINLDETFSWRVLKRHANTIRGVSFSALRAVIVRACLHQDEWKYVLERCNRIFAPKTTLKQPFQERDVLKPLPIDLVMGSKYVIYRPGNAQKIKHLLMKEGSIWFEFPRVFLNETLTKCKACWHAPKKVLRSLEHGAKVNLFRFNMPRGPGKTIKVDLILSGPEVAFLSGNHLNEKIFHEKQDFKFKSILGIDVNRLSEHVITGSMDLEMTSTLHPILEKWISLENTIKTLQQKRDTTRKWNQKHKLSTELRLTHLRRARLRVELLTKARIQLGKKILELDVDYVGMEAGLHKDTKDKKGALARAITSMPDNLALLSHELGIVNKFFQRNVKIVLVRKEGTSKYHQQCGGIIDRTGDEGICRDCGETINTHHNAANNVEE